MRFDALHFIALFINCVLAENGQQDYKMYTSRPDCGLSDNKGLRGNTTNIVRAENDVHCARKCNADVNCSSFNYNAKNHTCQLNWGFAGEDCQELTDMPGFKYYQQVEERCSHHGMWINETCGCRCEMPYFGKLCKKKYRENVVPRYHGNPPVNYKGNMGQFFNILTGMPFPLDSTVIGWVYYMSAGSAYRPFVGIYRPFGVDGFKLLYKTELPNPGSGNHSYLMDCPWHVQQGDVIGLHTTAGAHNGICICMKGANGRNGACAYGTYGSYSFSETLMNDAIIEGNNYTLKATSKLRKHAVQALFY